MDQGTFRYDNPSIIHWGAGCVAQRLEGDLQRLGSRRVFVVTTRSVAANPALIEPIERLLGERLVGRYGAIGQHAPVRGVAEAAAHAGEARPDLLLSVGGGSPIDAAKAVAFSLASGLDLNDPNAPEKASAISLAWKSVLPHIAIPTTLSTAEMSWRAGFSSEVGRVKTGVGAPELLPATIFFDAELAAHTPLPLWLSTGIRAVDHAVEAILSDGNHPFQDAMSLEALRRLPAALLAAQADPQDREARTAGQLGAWFSMTLPFASANGLSHTLGKRLGSRHGIPHGVTSCLMLPPVMRYLATTTAPQQARIARALGIDTPGPSDLQLAALAADAISNLIAQLGQPQRISDFNVPESDQHEAVRPLVTDRYSEQDLIGILRAAW